MKTLLIPNSSLRDRAPAGRPTRARGPTAETLSADPGPYLPQVSCPGTSVCAEGAVRP